MTANIGRPELVRAFPFFLFIALLEPFPPLSSTTKNRGDLNHARVI